VIGDLPYIHQVFATAIETIGSPAGAAERVALRSLLLEFALRGAVQIHTRVHHASAASCPFRAEATVLPFFKGFAGVDPRGAFLSWLDSYFEALAVAHPPSDAQRVANIIRRDHRKSLSTFTIARELGMAPVSVRLAFRTEFDLSIRKYLERIRIASAMRILEHGRTQKVESVAKEVGYQSKKNFYQAFQRNAGMTPAKFRRLPTETRRWVVDNVARGICSD